MSMPPKPENRDATVDRSRPSSPLELDNATVSRFLRLHYELQRGAFVSEWDHASDWLRISSNVSPAPMWNHIAWVGGRANEQLDILAELRREGTRSRRHPTAYVVPAQEAELRLDHRLSGQGVAKCDQEAWMFYRPADLQAGADRRSVLDVRIARSGQELKDFVSVFCAAYRATGTKYGELFHRESSPEPSLPDTTHYIAYAAGQPVCVATLISLGTEACIYNVGTAPAARKRGYAEQLLTRLIQDSQERGLNLVFLQAEKASNAERLYSRLGFVTAFTRSGYRLANWTPPKSVRSFGLGEQQVAPDQHFLECVYRDRVGIPEEQGQHSLRIACPEMLSARIAQAELKPETIWTAAWAVLLSRYSHEPRVSFGYLVGPTSNVFQLTVEVDEQERTATWLRKVEQTLASPSAARSRRTPALFESVLAPIADTETAPQRAELGAPLLCRICGGERPEVEVDYDGHMFDTATAQRLATHFSGLAAALVTSSDQPLASLPMLAPAEEAQLLVHWNGGLQRAIPFKPLHRLFEDQVAQRPHAPAVVLAGTQPLPEGSAPMSYAELNGLANQLANQLRSLGVKTEVPVAICLNRSAQLVVALLAVLKAGGVCVPLDPTYPKERLEYMLSDSNPAVLLTQERLLTHLPESTARCLCVDRDAAATSQLPGENAFGSTDPEAAAYVIYTSGSTGRPKGVVVTQRAIGSHCLESQVYYRLEPSDRVLQFNSFSFDAAFEQILAPLISGATLVVRGPDVWNSHEFGQQLELHALSVVDLPTAYWHQLLEDWTRRPAQLPRHLPRLVIVGGEAMSVESLRLWRQLPLQAVRLVNAYGPTETTITATAFEITSELLAAELPKRVPIGRPRGERRVYILDERNRPVPIGVSGQLHIGGPLLARGYLNAPELTAQKFVPDPFSHEPGARLYRTGDLARYLADGNIEFLGRADQQVKLRGYRVELGEVESILQQHPAVEQAVVILRDDAATTPMLVAYYNSREVPPPGAAQLREYLKQRLPEYMLPAAFVQIGEFPLLPSGKIDRRALPLPNSDAAVISEKTVAGPRTPMELRVQLLFEKVLRRPGVGIDVSFFELGGDSLQALELIVEIERMTNKNLPLETLYQHASVQALVELLEAQTGASEWSSLVPLQTGGTRPPLFLVHTTPGDILGYGNLIFHLDADQPCYGFQSLGLFRTELSHMRIEEMAAYYVSLLRAMLPKGPYYLGGWCYGGLVAVEMAQQLRAAGEEVPFLGLLETVAPAPSLRVLSYYLHRLECFLKMTPAKWGRYFQKKIQYHREARLANKMRFRRLEKTEGADTALIEEQNRRLAHLEHVYGTNLAALNFYKPRPYPGRVILFNAAEVDPGVIPDPLYAWKGLAKDIEVHTVPGDHDTMLTEPNVAVLAQKFDQVLRRVQTRYRPRRSAPRKSDQLAHASL